MTLRFIDSFDDRDTDYIEEKWGFEVGNVNANTIVGGGRNGTNCMTLAHAAQKWFQQEHGWTVGFGLYYHTDQVASFFSFWDVLDNYQLTITTTAGGLLQVASGAGIPIWGVSTAPLLFDQWQYVEIKVFCDATAGTVDIHLNGNSIYHIDGLNTDPTGAGAIATLVFPSLTADELLDDLYICDDNGTRNNDFLGDCHIESVLASGEGSPATAQWLNSVDDTASLYTMVNDNPPSGNRNYDEGASLPVKDVWSFPDIGSEANSILGVQVSALVRAEDGLNICNMRNICRSGGTDYYSDEYSLTEDYEYFSNIWEQNPTGIDWTRASFNAAEFGYEHKEDFPV